MIIRRSLPIAVAADVAEEAGKPRIAVEVAGPEGVRTVMIDAGSGQVTGTRGGGSGDDED